MKIIELIVMANNSVFVKYNNFNFEHIVYKKKHRYLYLKVHHYCLDVPVVDERKLFIKYILYNYSNFDLFKSLSQINILISTTI